MVLIQGLNIFLVLNF